MSFLDPGNIGTGIGDLFKAAGDFAEASDYGTAAKIAQQNEFLTKESTRIQQKQEQRKFFQVEGQAVAGQGGGNLGTGGSAGDVIRASAAQSGLQHQIIGLQGGIEANSFAEQATAYKGQQEAAKIAGVGNTVGAILGFFGL